LFGGLLVAGRRNEVFQLTGFFYPAILCGSALLLSENTPPVRFQWLAAAAAVATVAVRIPHFASATQAYAFNVPPTSIYTLSEMNRIADLAGTRRVSVEFDRSRPQPAIMTIVELGRRGVNLQWSPDSWWTVVGGWRGWPAPHYSDPADLVLIWPTSATPIPGAIYQSERFALLPTAP
jgi:hypothetical protein